MNRPLSLAAAALLVLGAGAWAQGKGEEKEASGAQASELKLEGVLIDGGCRNRTVWNMTRSPEPLNASIAPTGKPIPPGQAVQSSGITVDAKTIEAERTDVSLVTSNADSAVRQTDPTCAIKGNTRAFSLLLSSGRLLALDEAGNTYATAMVGATPQGRAMLNGQGPGFKPRVRVVGRIQGDRLLTEDLRVLQK